MASSGIKLPANERLRAKDLICFPQRLHRWKLGFLFHKAKGHAIRSTVSAPVLNKANSKSNVPCCWPCYIGCVFSSCLCLPLWLCLTHCRTRHLRAWEWWGTKPGPIETLKRKRICQDAGRDLRLPKEGLEMTTQHSGHSMYVLYRNDHEKSIDLPSFFINEESEDQQIITCLILYSNW